MGQVFSSAPNVTELQDLQNQLLESNKTLDSLQKEFNSLKARLDECKNLESVRQELRFANKELKRKEDYVDIKAKWQTANALVASMGDYQEMKSNYKYLENRHLRIHTILRIRCNIEALEENGRPLEKSISEWEVSKRYDKWKTIFKQSDPNNAADGFVKCAQKLATPEILADKMKYYMEGIQGIRMPPFRKAYFER